MRGALTKQRKEFKDQDLTPHDLFFNRISNKSTVRIYPIF